MSNEEDDIASMGNLLIGFDPTTSGCQSSRCGRTDSSNSANSVSNNAFGVDARAVKANTNNLPPTYRQANRVCNAAALNKIYGGGEKRTEPLTHTEAMLEKMHKDVGEFFFDEMIAKRAPRWQQDPNDPRTRRKAERDELARGSWRGFQW